MDEKRQRAGALLREFKGDRYVHGLGCFGKLGEFVAQCGHRAAVVTSGMGKPWGTPIHAATAESIERAGVVLAGDLIPGGRPNAPREDVFRIAQVLAERQADVVVTVGGGSGIDAAKAAVAYQTLGEVYPDFDGYFGVGKVSKMLAGAGRSLPPIVAAQLASGSAAHLTKYSNITDLARAQKLLIIDDAIVPPRSVFDYSLTRTMSRDFTVDGALDGVAHCLEVFYGAQGKVLEAVREVALLGIELIVSHLKDACEALDDLEAREALGLGTDLGGYAIMIGGTNGAHLTSFSLVDILSHGRACALMNPYYTVFFAPVIEDKLREVGRIYAGAGYTKASIETLHGRDLGIAVAEAMLTQMRDVGFPTTLEEVPGFTTDHIARALTAAKNPKLEVKLKAMPVSLTADQVDDYMGPILEAARTGDFSLIRNAG